MEGGGKTILIIVVLFSVETHAIVKSNRYNSPIRKLSSQSKEDKTGQP